MIDRITPEVDVLLGLYKPNEYLVDQLESLRGQVGVETKLIVSFDSDVETRLLSLINLWFPKAILIEGPRLGPMENYMKLLNYSKARYVAFCDQDDVWEAHHLINSIKRISDSINLPALSFSQCFEFGKKPERIWPIRPGLELHSIIFENPARGCTIVINSETRELIQDFSLTGMIMHDWLMLLSVQMTGNIVFGEKPEVFYRIHPHNTVGRPSKFRLNQLRNKFNQIPHPAIVQYSSVIENLRRKGIKIPEFGEELLDSFQRSKFDSNLFKKSLRMNSLEDKVYKLLLCYLFLVAKVKRKSIL
jgi:hypothetical protein